MTHPRGQPRGGNWRGLREQNHIAGAGTMVATENAISFTAPIRIISEQNAWDHWAIRNKRAKAQKNAVAARLAMFPARRWIEAHVNAERFIVTLERTGKKRLDSDGAVAGFKAVRDSIARWLRIDDGDEERLKFVYAPQVIGNKYGIAVGIEAGAEQGKERRCLD